MERARDLAKIERRISFEEMGEDGPRDKQCDLAITSRKRKGLQRTTGIHALVEHVMMVELEPRRVWRQTGAAPIDHALVRAHAAVSHRPGLLLNELPAKPAAPAAEIEHEGIRVRVDLREQKLAAAVIESLRRRRPHDAAQFQRRQGKVDH